MIIAADTSSFIGLLSGDTASDTPCLIEALDSQSLYLPPPVVTELLSDPVISDKTEKLIIALPLLEILPGFWKRAARNRSMLLRSGLKAKIADALIAQCCIDHDAVLITRDKDFRHYTKHCGLKLYVP